MRWKKNGIILFRCSNASRRYYFVSMCHMIDVSNEISAKLFPYSFHSRLSLFLYIFSTLFFSLPRGILWFDNVKKNVFASFSTNIISTYCQMVWNRNSRFLSLFIVPNGRITKHIDHCISFTHSLACFCF